MLKKPDSISFWNDPKKRAWFFQFLLILIVGVTITTLVVNTQTNMAKQNVAAGFDFLDQEAGFEISETMVEYWADDNYQRALWVGVLNTLKVGLIGNLFAILLGVIVGICRLSSHWLISKIAQVYIEVIRNIPLLLQLLFWYSLFTEVLPGVKEALELIPSVFLSQRGLVFPVFSEHVIWFWVKSSFVLSFPVVYTLKIFLRKRKEIRGGRVIPGYYIYPLIAIIPFCVWLIGGAPADVNYPELGGFNYNGGMTVTPEFTALVVGLVLYTGAFNAEIVRAGIESVKKGQWEASRALGLTQWQSLRLVILPQSLRVIIPPMTSQILNLIKNSSLAVGIGYPDFVSVANTTMNQTGQAIEGVLMIMTVYLFFSLSTSLFMNIYNKKSKIVQRGTL